MGVQPSDSLPTLLVVVGHLDDEPYTGIREAQLRTCLHPNLLHEYSRRGIHVLYAMSGPMAPAWQRLDRGLERLRWARGARHGGYRIFSPTVSLMTFPLRRWIPRTRALVQATAAGVGEWRVDAVPLHVMGVWRNLAVFREFLKLNFDYLYLTTTSSYIFPARIQEWLRENPHVMAAGSPIWVKKFAFSLPSGANRLIRRDVIERIVDNRRHYPRGFLDDVALGVWLHRSGISISHLSTRNCSSVEMLDELTPDELARVHHVRLKADHANGRQDSLLFFHLHSKLGNAAL